MVKGFLTFGLTRRPLVLLGLLLFVGAGLFAFSRLNIEAYPNPVPVILEITAQSPGQSAEEMERYFTISIEVGLAATPGVDVIRSTSFYGLSFVRVVFQYNVDYYFALTQTAINLQQNVSLPNNVVPQIQATSLVGEIFRYQLTGPPHFGLTNLRTLQDWVVQRRLLTVPGVVALNTWGGTTKEYDVDVDLHKLDAYGVTLPQVLTALGNANVNVGGRTINFGQQSVNIRGVGLMNSGGDSDLTQGYKVQDIENVPLSQSNGVPVFVKDVAKVAVGNVPRLGKAGRDHEDDIVAAIVIMNRTLHTNDVVARVRDEIAKINVDGSLPPGVKLVPFYDRTTLVNVTTATVLHNLFFGCILIFIIQWVFLGDLRSAIIVGANIPFALFFSIMILVLRGEDANLLSVGAVDFGIIVDAAVILVENVYRNFQAPTAVRQQLLHDLAEQRWGSDPARAPDLLKGPLWTDRLRLILISALQIDRAVFFSTTIIVAAFIPARLKREADTSRRRAKEIGELHAFSHRLATCLTSRELIFAVQDYLSNTLGYRALLIAGPAAPDHGFEAASLAVPEVIRQEASELAPANKVQTLTKVDPRTRSAWLITTIVPEILGYGAIAIDLGVASAESVGRTAKHVTAVIDEVTATLKHLKVKEAIEQATINYQTEILRDALVGGVSHELRTPLAAILGTCSVLNQMPVILNDEPSQTLIDAIHDQAIALDKQIRDVLDAVRISAKGVHPQLMWTDPTDIVDAAVKQKTARLASHQIVFDVRQDVPLVYVDSVLVEQAFGQLLENAAKYSPAGTAIKIRSRCDRGYVELSVADQGSGLTAEEKEQLGKRSYRSERNAAVSGSGLGLWIASTFIEANGGTLYAESDGPHLGTTISLRLPTVSEDTPELLDALND